MMLARILKSMRDKHREIALGACLNDASALSTIGLVIVILRKQANPLHTEIDTRRQIIFPMRRQGIDCTNWNKAIAMRFNIAGEPFIRRLRMPVKCGFDIRRQPLCQYPICPDERPAYRAYCRAVRRKGHVPSQAFISISIWSCSFSCQLSVVSCQLSVPTAPPSPNS